ncbi:hypothetical protein HY480_05060 [Candidatus Uhrbacteria bacterium]|nr:hypothetical protein [Candidatus Uhrbacteria bacterium]
MAHWKLNSERAACVFCWKSRDEAHALVGHTDANISICDECAGEVIACIAEQDLQATPKLATLDAMTLRAFLADHGYSGDAIGELPMGDLLAMYAKEYERRLTSDVAENKPEIDTHDSDITDEDDIDDLFGGDDSSHGDWPEPTPEGDDIAERLVARQKSALKQTMEDLYGVPFIECSPEIINSDAVALIPRGYCNRYCAIPISVDSMGLVLAMANPRDRKALAEARRVSGRRFIIARAATEDNIREMIECSYASDPLPEPSDFEG